MGLTIDYFYSLTPRQFQNTLKGWRDLRDAESKERMIFTRRIMYATLMPYKKNLQEQEVWPFEWEKTTVISRTEEEEKQMLSDLDATIKRWEERDKRIQNAKKEQS